MDEASHIISIEDKIAGALTGQASQDELATLRRWLNESEVNRKQYHAYVALWVASAATGRTDDYRPDAAWTLLDSRIQSRMHLQRHSQNQSAPSAPDSENPPLATPLHGRVQVRFLVKVLVAAAVLALVFLAGMRVDRFADKPAAVRPVATYTEYTSPLGSKSMVRMPDGTSVWLNAGSVLRYASDFHAHHREVYLEGEGYFDVTRDEESPFFVQTSTITIKVLGTTFNVKAYPEESFIETTVERGSVQLIDPSSSTAEAILLRANQKAVVLKGSQPVAEPADAPSQELRSETIKPLQPVPIADVHVRSNVRTALYTSWKDPRWVIEAEDLSSLAVKLERRYNVHFVFADEALKQNVFSGKLEDETLDQVLEVIKLSSPILYKVKNNTVYLSRNMMFNQKK